MLPLLSLVLIFGIVPEAAAQKRRPHVGGRLAIVADERLAALRESPDLTAGLVRRLGRGSRVAILGAKRAGSDGAAFYRVAVTRRTRGWLLAEAVVTPGGAGEDARLLRLVRGSEDFDRLARARIFLEAFPRSPLRPAVLLIFGDAAREAARHLSREAARRLDESEMEAGGAAHALYFLNYSGLDRYRRLGVVFDFDPASKRYSYDGAAYREILRRYPHSPQAVEARQRRLSPN